MKLETRIPLIDEILSDHAVRFHADLTGYRNHVYRMVHFCLVQGAFDEVQSEKIVIAGCFHDLGIWSDDTLDYLPRSVALARTYLSSTGREDWIPDITLMIDLHHRIRKYRGEPALVETFRRGDLVDFSLGAIRSGVDRRFIREVKKTFPNEGFHRDLLTRACRWTLRHPLNPIPVLKW